VSSTWDSVLNVYRITIAEENYSARNYITVVTLIGELGLSDTLRLVRTYSDRERERRSNLPAFAHE